MNILEGPYKQHSEKTTAGTAADSISPSIANVEYNNGQNAILSRDSEEINQADLSASKPVLEPRSHKLLDPAQSPLGRADSKGPEQI